MMDPGQQPATDDNRDFSRKVRDSREPHDQPADIARPQENSAADDREFRDFAPNAYRITDLHGTIREVNVAAGKLLGVEPKFLTGKSLPAFFDERGRREYRHQLDRICDFDRLDDWEIALQPRGGEAIAVSVTMARGPRKGKGTGSYRWILRDITKRVRAEEALRELNRELELRVGSRTAQLAAANRMKDELLLSERKAREEAEVANRVKADFLALLSHEFRTPLQAIFGYTELLEREIHGPLTDAQRRDLKRIQQSQQHLLGLITTILDFARLENGQGIAVELAPVVVHEILCNMEGFVGPQLEAKGLEYSYTCENEKLAVTADAAKLEQIVLNLLANAIKFTPSGGTVFLECTSRSDQVHICVRDTGIGIPPDKLDDIFEPFVQLRSNGMTAGGTGLGLPISRSLATAMGGELNAESIPGKGSSFTLSLRSVVEANATPPAPPPSSRV